MGSVSGEGLVLTEGVFLWCPHVSEKGQKGLNVVSSHGSTHGGASGVDSSLDPSQRH